MSALNFPNSPVDGQIYSDVTTNSIWIYNATFQVWETASTSSSLVQNSYDHANGAFTQANTAVSSASIALTRASGSFDRANGAFDRANTGSSTANTALTQANSSYNHANGAFDHANSAFSAANAITSFTTIVVPGQSNVVADSQTDTLTIVAGSGMSIETDVINDALVFSTALTVELQDDTTTDNNQRYILFNANTESVGNVFVSSTKLFFNPSTGNLFSTIASSSNVITETVTASGTIEALDFNSTSDITLKENIVPIENSLNIIENLTGIKFNWKDNKETSYGLSAQDVEQILPEIVKTRENGLKGVNYLNIIAILIESVKKLNNEINEIKKHINKV